MLFLFDCMQLFKKIAVRKCQIGFVLLMHFDNAVYLLRRVERKLRSAVHHPVHYFPEHFADNRCILIENDLCIRQISVYHILIRTADSFFLHPYNPYFLMTNTDFFHIKVLQQGPQIECAIGGSGKCGIPQKIIDSVRIQLRMQHLEHGGKVLRESALLIHIIAVSLNQGTYVIDYFFCKFLDFAFFALLCP